MHIAILCTSLKGSVNYWNLRIKKACIHQKMLVFCLFHCTQWIKYYKITLQDCSWTLSALSSYLKTQSGDISDWAKRNNKKPIFSMCWKLQLHIVYTLNKGECWNKHLTRTSMLVPKIHTYQLRTYTKEYTYTC